VVIFEFGIDNAGQALANARQNAGNVSRNAGRVILPAKQAVLPAEQSCRAPPDRFYAARKAGKMGTEGP
jgi:hypothetical protein